MQDAFQEFKKFKQICYKLGLNHIKVADKMKLPPANITINNKTTGLSFILHVQEKVSENRYDVEIYESHESFKKMIFHGYLRTSKPHKLKHTALAEFLSIMILVGIAGTSVGVLHYSLQDTLDIDSFIDITHLEVNAFERNTTSVHVDMTIITTEKNLKIFPNISFPKPIDSNSGYQYRYNDILTITEETSVGQYVTIEVGNDKISAVKIAKVSGP